MLIDVFELARTGAQLEGRVAISSMERLRDEVRDASGALDYRFAGHTDACGRPAARLQVRGELPLTCDRCGGAVSVPVDRRSTFFFVADQAELNALPVTVDDDPEPLLGSTHFDLSALIEDEAILSVPLSPRHEECPTDIREAEKRAGSGAPNPFARLGGLLRKGGR